MLGRLKTLFTEAAEEESTIKPELAAAALMFEVIWADHDVAEPELQVMKTHLTHAFDVQTAQIDQIVEETKRLHDESVGLHEFTSVLNENITQEEKVSIVQALWRIAVADAQIDSLEEHMIRRISDLLYVSHKDFIAAKLAAKAT